MNADRDNITTVPTAEARRPSPRRPWLRHLTAAVVAVTANVGLAMLLATWRADDGKAATVPLRAVPLRVVEPEPVEARLEPAEPVASPAPSPPQAQPPPVPLPRQRPLALTDLAPPPLGALLVGEFDIATIPAFGAAVAVPGAVATGPVGPPPATGPTTKPAPAGAWRGPTMITPPNLADYYPRRALRRGTTGKTTVRLTIDSHGVVDTVRILSSTPPGVFETAAGRAAKSLTFMPARRAGRPARTSVTLNFVWKLD